MSASSGRRPCSEERERGAVLIEFSFVFALFAMICYGIVAFGMTLSFKNSMTHAASEGARGAIPTAVCLTTTSNPSPAYTACVNSIATAAISQAQQSLSGQGANAQYAQITSNLASCGTGSQCITVTITYPYSAHPLIPQAPGLGIVMPSSLTSTATVRVS